MTRRKTAGMRQMIPDNSFIHQKTTIMKKYMFFCALLTALNSFAKTGDTSIPWIRPPLSRMP